MSPSARDSCGAVQRPKPAGGDHAVCGTTHRESYLGMVTPCIVSALAALVGVVLLQSLVGSF